MKIAIDEKKPIIKKSLAMAVADKVGVSVLKAEKIIDDMMDAIADELRSGRAVKLIGFGSFVLRDKKARPGRNPKTGATVTIQPRRVVLFRVGTRLRKSLRLRAPSTKLVMKKK